MNSSSCSSSMQVKMSSSIKRQYTEQDLAPLGSRARVDHLGPERGFGLVANERMTLGQVIIDREPPAAATLNPGPSTRCGLCWKNSPTTPFTCDCGVRYCCPECKDLDSNAHHFLCTFRVEDESHPLVTFKIDAMQTNPMFLTAARMVSLALAHPTIYCRKFDNIQHAEWEKAVPCPKAEPDPVHFANELRTLAEETRAHLERALSDSIDATPACSKFSSYLGCLEMNQFEICIDDDEEACGAGVFSLCCCANHSCDPNAEIIFISGTNHATIRALREIQPNEEICVSYIDNQVSLDERRAELEDYGFQCSCARCSQEEKWIAQQLELASRVISDRCVPDNLKQTLSRVGGFDISFPVASDQDDSIACLVVMSYPDLKVVYESCIEVRMTEPYIPGFLAFREAAICQDMLSRIANPLLRPQVLILDGCGVLHPRSCGLASHIGVVCNLPTIGVSKKMLAVDGLTRDGVKQMCKRKEKKNKTQSKEINDVIDLIGDSGKLWGRALISPGATNPVFVSVGHRLDLDTATDIVRETCKKTRVPAPVRQADLTSREALRQRTMVPPSSAHSMKEKTQPKND